MKHPYLLTIIFLLTLISWTSPSYLIAQENTESMNGETMASPPLVETSGERPLGEVAGETIAEGELYTIGKKRFIIHAGQVVFLTLNRGLFVQQGLILNQGRVEVVVENRAGRRGRFIIEDPTRPKKERRVLNFLIESNTIEARIINLEPGSYYYYCANTKTPRYPIEVRER